MSMFFKYVQNEQPKTLTTTTTKSIDDHQLYNKNYLSKFKFKVEASDREAFLEINVRKLR